MTKSCPGGDGESLGRIGNVLGNPSGERTGPSPHPAGGEALRSPVCALEKPGAGGGCGGGPAAGLGPAIPPAASSGGRIAIRALPDGEEIVLRPRGCLRFPVAAFLSFWLCGWAAGEAIAIVVLLGPWAEPLVEAARELFPGLVGRVPLAPARMPLPLLAFLALWLAFWTWGGISAAWELLRVLAGSDRYVLRAGRVSFRRCAGPFGRTRELRAGAVDAIVHRPRKSLLLAVVAGKERTLSTGVPPDVGPWLAERLREALGLSGSAPGPSAAAGPDSAAAPPCPPDWRATERPDGGVVLDAPPARSRRAAGCALAVALPVTAGAGALLAAVVSGKGPSGLAAFAVVVAVAIDLLCLWAAVARDAWLLAKGRVERVRSFGPWTWRRVVRNGTLVASLSTDGDGDDWFAVEARGEGGPLRLAKTMNAGPEVLAFARFAAWRSGFPLEVPEEFREAAGEEPAPGGGRHAGPR